MSGCSSENVYPASIWRNGGNGEESLCSEIQLFGFYLFLKELQK